MNTIKIPEIKIGEHILKEIDFSIYGQRAYIITDTYMVGHIDELFASLKNQNIEYTIFENITGEPTDIMLKDAYRNDYDFLIGIGGGSVLDSAKLIACHQERKPFILIPTTAGTGSEVTKFSILTYVENNEKKLLVDERFIPELAVIDYALSCNMPSSLVAATGLDAFCHALEAYTSRKHNPISDTFALSAIKRILAFLPDSYQNGTREARQEMALAALEAGIAFNHSSVTIIHGMSRPIGAAFHVPHGLSNAMLLDVCMPVIGKTQRYSTLCQQLSMSEEEFIEKVKTLCAICNVPTIQGYGIKKEDFLSAIEKMSHDALNSGSPQNTYTTIDKQLIIDLYKQLIGETLC